jgi:uncharacterized protein YgbK (DUF1537 family)
MTQLLVIADDLTGALDTGVQLAKAGIPTEVRIFSETQAAVEETEPSSLVVVADTESRHLPAGEAYERVRNAAAWGRALGIKRFYKKTDSTLRGNVGPEIAALIAASVEAGETGLLVFAPAFPALGRTTENGRQLVDGVSLEKTAFARDRLNPITTGSIEEILRKDADLSVRVTGPSGLADALPAARDKAASGEPAVIVVNGRTEEDLAETARIISAPPAGKRAGKPELPLMAGCAGFARYLPGILGIRESAAETPAPAEPFLAVNGSLNPVSLGQVRAAVRGGFEDVALLPDDLASPDGREAVTARLAGAAAAGRPCILRNILHPEELDAYIASAEKLGVSGAELHAVMPRVYGEIIRALVSRTGIGTLVVFGGDTLVGILEAFGKKSVIPLAEAFPGVVTARVPGVPNPRYLTTKAGGFGGEDLLPKLLRLARGF